MENGIVLYLHGFASSGQGTKAQYFRSKCEPHSQVTFRVIEFNSTPKDFEYMTITGLVDRLRQYLLPSQQPRKISFIGSSLGGLVGLLYAHRFGRVERILLLAPALTYLTGKYSEAELQQWQREGAINAAHYAFKEAVPLWYDYQRDGLHYLEPVPLPTRRLMIHGRNDVVVPIGNSRTHAASYSDYTQLVEVDSDHRLNDRLDLICDHVRSFLLS